LLLLLLFVLFSYTIPTHEEVMQSGGLEVNLGTSSDGSGTDQPMSRKEPAAYQATVMYKSVAQAAAIPKDIVRSQAADAPDVSSPTKRTKPAQAAEPARATPQPRPQARYVYPGGTGAGGNSAAQDAKGTSEGNTSGPGDRGVPGGTPGASNYTGIPGNGTGGIGHTLSGRKISPDKFEAEFREGGKVVIHVTVDRNGSIISRRIISSPSRELSQLALEKLSNARFSKSEGQEPEQSGDVTFYFKTRQ
jgi:TonB family protein